MFFNVAAYKDGFLTYFYRLIFIWHRLCQKHNFLQSFACCKSLRDEINTRWKPRQIVPPESRELFLAFIRFCKFSVTIVKIFITLKLNEHLN